MVEWTMDHVATRFSQAARTAQRLPAVRVQGYFNVWPAIVRTEFELMNGERPRASRCAPTPADVDQMLETMRWVLWLEVEQRHLVWMRADRYEWDQIGQRFGCSRSTAWRRWKLAMTLVAAHLNATPKPMGQGG